MSNGVLVSELLSHDGPHPEPYLPPRQMAVIDAAIRDSAASTRSFSRASRRFATAGVEFVQAWRRR